MAKNILIFSDGTRQEGGEGNNTNVYKLFNMVEDRTDQQIAFYDAGLGTDWRKITGSALGNGISQNILECYGFLMDYYKAGDQIYLFRFSRGATTVRSLSGFINLFGVLPKSRKDLIKKAYKIYQISDIYKRNKLADEFINKHHTMWTRIKFIGVWDTVAALAPFRNDFHDLGLAECVDHGCQALALDEQRSKFSPTLWGKSERVEQVWFAGSHTDIGGGYADDGLGDVTLMWMTCKAIDHGLRIYKHHKVHIRPDCDGFIHDSRAGIGSLYKKKLRSWSISQHGELVLADCVTKRKGYTVTIEIKP